MRRDIDTVRNAIKEPWSKDRSTSQDLARRASRPIRCGALGAWTALEQRVRNATSSAIIFYRALFCGVVTEALLLKFSLFEAKAETN
ncbi:MAG: hypothetical protein ACLPKT_15485, partial [Methylocella sp.]